MGKYFTVQELCKSSTAKQKKIANIPTPEIARNLTALIDNILDPLREAFGRPIAVNSGYRCHALNKAVGGVLNSQHLTGHAADLTTGTIVGNQALFNLIRKLGLPFDQLIDESHYAWVHVSYDPKRNRRQVLKL